jgi:hypothetical protein
MIAYFATSNGRVVNHEFGRSNLDRRVQQAYVNRNNAAAARRGDDSKPYALLTVEFESRDEVTAFALDGDKPVKVTIVGEDRLHPSWSPSGFDVQNEKGRTWYTSHVWDTAEHAAQAAAEIAEALDL